MGVMNIAAERVAKATPEQLARAASIMASKVIYVDHLASIEKGGTPTAWPGSRKVQESLGARPIAILADSLQLVLKEDADLQEAAEKARQAACEHTSVQMTYDVEVYVEVDRDEGMVTNVRTGDGPNRIDGETKSECQNCGVWVEDAALVGTKPEAIAESAPWPSW